MIKAIIFDYDGVLVDSFPASYKVYNTMAKELNKPRWTSHNQLKKTFLRSYKENYQEWGLTPEQWKRCEKIYLNKTRELGKTVPLISGVKETLTELKKHYRLIIGSGTYKAIMLPRLKELGIDHFFELVVGLEDHKSVKPAPDLLKFCMKKLNLSNDEVLYVGDMISDILMGRTAGVITIIMSTHSWNSEEDIMTAGPDILIKRLEELPLIIRKEGIPA